MKVSKGPFQPDDSDALTLSAKLAAFRIEEAANESKKGKEKFIFKDAVTDAPEGEDGTHGDEDDDAHDAADDGSGPSGVSHLLNDEDDGLIAYDSDEEVEEASKGEIASRSRYPITLLISEEFLPEVPRSQATIKGLLTSFPEYSRRCSAAAATTASDTTKIILKDPSLVLISTSGNREEWVCLQDSCEKAHGSSFEQAAHHALSQRHRHGARKGGESLRLLKGKINLKHLKKDYGACRRRPFYAGVLAPFMANSTGKQNFILIGDLNMVEDPLLDRSSGAGSSGENSSVVQICSAHCLADAFRWMNPVLKEFTFLSRQQRSASRERQKRLPQSERSGADDTTLVLKGKRQVGRAVKLLNEFGDQSGLRVNNDKSALMPLGGNLRKKPDKKSAFKWVLPSEAERVLGVWVSPSGDALVTWEITLVRATSELLKWQVHYLTTSGRVAVVNGYINPILAFQAQVYPPPREIWAKLVKLLHNFVTGNHSTAGKQFALWSQELLFKGRGEGGLGVRDPCAELGGLAARRIALLASQPLGLRADLALAALDVPDLQVFWAHTGLIKQWEGRCMRWKRTCELFLESSFPSCISVSSVWDVEHELLLFNRMLLLNGKTPAGRQKAAKGLKRSVMKDLINVVEDGSRALKGTQELEREFGGSAGAKLARRVFVAAPDEWKQLLLAPVTAHTVLAASKFVLKAGTSHGVWRIECVEGETLVCRAISCFRGALGDAEEKLRSFQPREVIPAVVREGRFLGPAGAPKERLLCSPIWDGDRPAQLKQLKEGFKRWGGKPKQQATWEETLGRQIDWERVIDVRDSTALPNRARDVMLRIHSRNLQVGERLHFLGTGVACPHCGERETLEHGLFLCPRIQPVVRSLLKALRMLNPHRKIETLGDLVFKKEGTASGFPEASLTAIALHRIWVERCDAVFERSKFRAKRALRRIAASFQLHVRIYKRAKAASKRLGATRHGLDDDECRVLSHILDNTAQPATWSKGFMAIWSNPRAAFRPP
ncbi:unnamed protein product [Closterium sp. NIES-65]|nr:unnamed protein product [Closterium sp. NIES-65]